MLKISIKKTRVLGISEKSHLVQVYQGRKLFLSSIQFLFTQSRLIFHILKRKKGKKRKVYVV